MAFFEKFGEKLTNAGKDVAKKTKELADIAKLNMQISNEEDTIKNKYLEIGKLYYELFSSSPDEKFTEFCSSISESKNKIDTLKDQIQQVKGVKKCSKCGAEIAYTATFCSSCGNQNASVEVAQTDKEDASDEVDKNVEVVENGDVSNDIQTGESVETSDIEEVVDSVNVPEVSENTASTCPICSNTVAADVAFCPNCGNKSN